MRAVARSQSLPTPHIHEPADVVVKDTLGADPDDPLDTTAPFMAVLAPLNETTVRAPSSAAGRLAVTVALVRTAGAVACHISAVPGCELERVRRVQERPAPVTVVKVMPLVGPSEVANASSTSLA